MVSFILPANSASGGYEVANSVRLNNADNAYFSQTPSSSSGTTFTYSMWIKRGRIGLNGYLIRMVAADNSEADLIIESDKIRIQEYEGTGGTNKWKYITNRVFRDPSAWYHIMYVVDTNNGTASDRVKLYINGVRETSFSTATNPSSGATSCLATTGARSFGGKASAGSFDGYMAECVYVDGTAKSTTDFGEFDEDSPTIWKPIDVSSMSLGSTGWYLDFEDSSSLGNDASGSNNWTSNNLAATDQTTDTCTNNFSTLNPLNGSGTRTQNDTYSEGNTIMIPANHDNYTTTLATMGAMAGKWYWEAQSIVQGTASNAYYPRTIGIMRDDYGFDKSTLGQDDDKTWDVVYNSGNWDASHNNSVVVDNMSTDRTSGNILNFALDLDNGKFYFGINGTWLNSGDPTTGSTGTGAIHTLDSTDLSHFIIPAVTNATTGTYYKFNFGNPAFSISSGNADGNGYGNFEYAPPSGYYAWCTKNLAEYG